METKRSEHDRVSSMQAAYLYKHFDFNEPCTRNIYANDNGRNITIGVPTVSHVIDFLSRKGYDIKVENFDDELMWVMLQKS